jgi:hypothetical protein
MIHMVPFDVLVNLMLLIVLVHIVQKLVALSELVYNELLKLNHIDNVE